MAYGNCRGMCAETMDLGEAERSPHAELAVYGDLVAKSSSMRKLFTALARLESSDLDVLIEGETGTGKELVARAIHAHSRRQSGPLVVVNCGAVQRDLAASELFGHRKGAFTGAIESRIGAFEAAQGGTLFLDEVGELPLELQPLLLRALEQRVVTRLGETQGRAVDVRVIAATHVGLEREVASGGFRQDLYHRLAVLRLSVPPLRERPEDVALLSSLFARRAAGVELSPATVAALVSHDWPGNVRELRHAVESFLVLGTLPQFTRPDSHQALSLEQFANPSRPYAELKHELLREFNDLYLSRLLARTSGNVAAASRLSGIERSYLNKLVRRMPLVKVQREGCARAKSLVSDEGSTSSVARSVRRQRS
ncbi:MAG: sigma 54-interacting transcriptional regulator [Myxococcota bacterium]